MTSMQPEANETAGIYVLPKAMKVLTIALESKVHRVHLLRVPFPTCRKDLESEVYRVRFVRLLIPNISECQTGTHTVMELFLQLSFGPRDFELVIVTKSPDVGTIQLM